MKLIVDLNLRWSKLLVTPKDFIALSEILSRAQVVEEVWTEKSGRYLVENERQKMLAEEETRTPITQQMMEVVKAAEKEKENAIAV
jgi:RNA polymerase-interacting CarD/CdnL/TRCF family regulator